MACDGGEFARDWVSTLNVESSKIDVVYERTLKACRWKGVGGVPGVDRRKKGCPLERNIYKKVITRIAYNTYKLVST
jgi:hypothetical protein